MNRLSTTSRTFLLGLCLSASACGGSGPEPFVLRLIADDGSAPGGPGNAIIQRAVDRVQIVVAPDPSTGNAFDPAEPRVFDGGDVETRVSAAGEWVITLERAYLDDHAFPHGTTFAVDVPLSVQDTTDDPSVRDPTLRVSFQRRGEVIASTERRLVWPPTPGTQVDAVVFCSDATRFQCQNNDPPAP